MGFTLIETIIYMALFALVMGGFLVGIYQVAEAHRQAQGKVYTQEEGNFLLHKVDWALTGASVIHVPAVNDSGDVLRVENNGVVFEFRLESGHVQLSRNGVAFSDLNGDSVTISGLAFSHADPDGAGGKPARVIASFLADGQYFETVKYLRQ